MANMVEAAIAEVIAAKAVVDPQVEGFKDWAGLNLKNETQGEIAEALQIRQRRQSLLEAALDILRALMADGYPGLPLQEMSEASYDDIEANVSTILAAFGQMTEEQASDLNLTPKDPEPKA